VLAGADRVRHHSSATLLPDGRVLTGGGGVCASCVSAGYLEKNVEYLEPPYRYKQDAVREFPARRRTTMALARSSTACEPAARLTWRSEFLGSHRDRGQSRKRAALHLYWQHHYARHRFDTGHPPALPERPRPVINQAPYSPSTARA
jgi:hypothetical protein